MLKYKGIMLSRCTPSELERLAYVSQDPEVEAAAFRMCRESYTSNCRVDPTGTSLSTEVVRAQALGRQS